MRVPCIANGPGAVGTQLPPWQAPPVGAGAPSGTGVPSWVWSVGFIILMIILRVGCRAMNH